MTRARNTGAAWITDDNQRPNRSGARNTAAQSRRR